MKTCELTESFFFFSLCLFYILWALSRLLLLALTCSLHLFLFFFNWLYGLWLMSQTTTTTAKKKKKEYRTSNPKESYSSLFFFFAEQGK